MSSSLKSRAKGTEEMSSGYRRFTLPFYTVRDYWLEILQHIGILRQILEKPYPVSVFGLKVILFSFVFR
jgi:hypothetical protein